MRFMINVIAGLCLTGLCLTSAARAEAITPPVPEFENWNPSVKLPETPESLLQYAESGAGDDGPFSHPGPWKLSPPPLPPGVIEMLQHWLQAESKHNIIALWELELQASSDPAPAPEPSGAALASGGMVLIWLAQRLRRRT